MEQMLYIVEHLLCHLEVEAEVDDDDLAKAIEYAHSMGKKVHAAINIYAWDNTYEEIRKTS